MVLAKDTGKTLQAVARASQIIAASGPRADRKSRRKSAINELSPYFRAKQKKKKKEKEKKMLRIITARS